MLNSDEIIGTFSGTLIIMGSAAGLHDDMIQVKSLWPDAHRMAVNHTGLLTQEYFEHWASCHMELGLYRPEWRYGALMSNPDMDGEVTMHSQHECDGDVYKWSKLWDRGSSSMFAVKVGLALGCDNIILAGVPLDNSGKFYHFDGPKYKFGYNQMLENWEAESKDWNGRVTSMSGNTRKILGAPKVN